MDCHDHPSDGELPIRLCRKKTMPLDAIQIAISIVFVSVWAFVGQIVIQSNDP